MNKSTILQLRVYYEDTDCSGRVYHAAYLKFMERARTEFLRHCGLTHGTIQNLMGEPCFFAVHKMEMTFKAPACLDDEISVQTSIRAITGATLELDQIISKQENPVKILVTSVVRIVLVKNSGRPMRFNQSLIAYFQ